MDYTNFPVPSGSVPRQRLPAKGFLNYPRAETAPRARTYGFLNKPPPPPPPPEKTPYAGYSRTFTSEGGILISSGGEEGISAGVAFCLMTGFELFIIVGLGAPFGSGCLTMLIFFWLNVSVCAGLSGTKQSVEVRPDCIIIDGKDVFWRHFMEGEWPRFKPNGKDSRILGGIYGTRFIEYLTINRSDELDRTPEVFSKDLLKAMFQLWQRPG